MDNQTEKIFSEQLTKLPKDVVDYIATSNWETSIEEIGSMYNLEPEQLEKLVQEVTFVITGLAAPDEFSSTLEEETGIHGAVLDAVITAVDRKIFAPVQSSLETFFANEEVLASSAAPQPVQDQSLGEAPVVPPPFQASVIPPNLPTAPEPEHLIPPIAPKVFDTVVMPQQMVPHPFEEKMKRVFTPSEPVKDALVLEPIVPKEVAPSMYVADTLVPKAPVAPTPAPFQTAPTPVATPQPQVATPAPSARRTDPYREPIE